MCASAMQAIGSRCQGARAPGGLHKEQGGRCLGGVLALVIGALIAYLSSKGEDGEAYLSWCEGKLQGANSCEGLLQLLITVGKRLGLVEAVGEGLENGGNVCKGLGLVKVMG